MWVCITSTLSKSLYGVCYRPPDSTDNFVSNLRENLTAVRSKFPKAGIFILGDFNFPDIDWPNSRGNSRACNDIVQLVLDFSFEQLVLQPTRITNVLEPCSHNST